MSCDLAPQLPMLQVKLMLQDVCHVYLVAFHNPLPHPHHRDLKFTAAGQTKGGVLKMGLTGTLTSLWGRHFCDWITLGSWLVSSWRVFNCYELKIGVITIQLLWESAVLGYSPFSLGHVHKLYSSKTSPNHYTLNFIFLENVEIWTWRNLLSFL